MLRNKRFIALLAAGFILIGNAFSQTSTEHLGERYLLKAEDALDSGNIEEAYKNINNALKVMKTFQTDSEIPTNALILGRTVYRAKAKRLLEKYSGKDFADIKANLELYPEINTAEISKLIRQIETDEQELRDIETKGMQENLAETLKESMAITREQNAQTQNNFRNIFILIVVLVAVILVIVLLIMLIVRSLAKHAKIQQSQYAEAFRLLAANQSQTNRLMLGSIAGLYSEDGLKLVGSSSTWAQDALPPPEPSDEEKAELQELAIKCEELGAKIDQVTNRKNNSKNVSELVYKLAIRLGVYPQEALVYCCASMVYDAGFLAIDPAIMAADTLTESQRKELNRHIDLGDAFIQFVPKRYWQIFTEAAHYHHENMDGSGIPEGLKGEEIPRIARIIRVADSYNALTSRRSFRKGTDKEAAILLLEEKKEIYDQDIITALRDII